MSMFDQLDLHHVILFMNLFTIQRNLLNMSGICTDLTILLYIHGKIFLFDIHHDKCIIYSSQIYNIFTTNFICVKYDIFITSISYICTEHNLFVAYI